MTQNVLFEILINLHEAKYNVIAIVSDMGSTNIGLWRALNISTDNVAFCHPVTTKKIYVSRCSTFIKISQESFD